jgi:prepilin-type N-terminal cleavage/methylation domain-containing protein
MFIYKNDSTAGFTLVELAIVLMIIGLLIGGILKGQELIENARVASTATQVNGIRAALITFQDSYAALPGDMANGSTRLANCASGPCNGNGNGIIDDGGGNMEGQHPFGNTSSEGLLFWRHLLKANLLTGIGDDYLTAGLTQDNFKAMFPAGKFGGSFIAGFATTNVHYQGTGYSPKGVLVTLVDYPGFGWGEQNNGVITPSRAAQLDRKMDDGKPSSGDIVSYSVSTSSCMRSDSGSFIYEESANVKDCGLLFGLQ